MRLPASTRLRNRNQAWKRHCREGQCLLCKKEDLLVMSGHIPCRMVAMEQPLCLVGTRCIQVFLIKRLHRRIFMGETQRRVFIKCVQRITAGNRLFAVAAVNRLTSAARTAARARHNFNKFVPDFPVPEGFYQPPCIAKPTGDGAAQGGFPKLEGRFQPFPTFDRARPDFTKGIGRRVFPVHKEVSGAQRGSMRLMHELCKCPHWCQNSTRLHSLLFSL